MGVNERKWILLPSNLETFQVIILDSDRRNELKLGHHNKASGHLGIKKDVSHSPTALLLAGITKGCAPVYSRHLLFVPQYTRDVRLLMLGERHPRP